MHSDVPGLADARTRLLDVATRHLGRVDAETVVAMARPAVALVHTTETDRVSRLGGQPVLAPDAAWPSWDGKPLTLVAVIDLAEVARFELDIPLPTTGMVNVFYEADEQQAWGFDPATAEGWRLVLNDGRTAGAGTRDTPAGVLSFAAIPVACRQILTVPDVYEPAVEDRVQRQDDALFELVEAWDTEQFGDAPRHQIGGWPRLVQNPLQLECQLASNGIYVGDAEPYTDAALADIRAGADQWRLAVQIDTDERAGWMWGDAGTLYYALTDADMRDERFERTWMVLQCS